MSPDSSINSRDPLNVGAWLANLKRELESKNQRILLSVEGQGSFRQKVLEELNSCFDKSLLVSDEIEMADATQKSPDQLLGQEASLINVDLNSGLNPDAFCLAAGLVKSGGIMAVFSSGPENWNIDQDRYGVWQESTRSQSMPFIQYFYSVVKNSSSVVQLIEGKKLPKINDFALSPMSSFVEGKTPDQKSLLEKVMYVCKNNKKALVAITAARGRGKSSSLGLLTEQLEISFGWRCIITAASKQNAQIAMNVNAALQFYAPDALLKVPVPADVLVVDEAARIPHSILRQLTQRYKIVVMATTTDGYEGTGQGFLLRFIKRWEKSKLAMLGLENPVRWGSTDLLESWINRSFFLDTAISIVSESPSIPLHYQSFSPQQLIDSGLLESVYRLLVSAHYRSQPSDLRNLMENPDQHIFVAHAGSQVRGVLIVNREGSFDQSLADEVFFGRRRPRGHLLAQMLTAQAGSREFACLKGFRILRVAVNEKFRRQGIASELIKHAEAFTKQEEYDYLGACFAFDAEISKFWKHCGFSLAHIGFGEGKSSGNHSVVMIKSDRSDTVKLIAMMKKNLNKKLPVWFCQFLRWMDVESVIALLRISGFKACLNEIEKNEIDAFRFGFKPFEISFISLQHLLMDEISKSEESETFDDLLILKGVQNREWDDVKRELKLAGRKQMETQLRALFSVY